VGAGIGRVAVVSPTAPAVIALVTTAPADTRGVAAAIAGVVRAGDVVLLVGDLGAGKTTFAQGVGAAMGVDGPVTSPTFTLVRTYPVADGAPPGVRSLLHADLYRLDRLHEVVELGLGEQVDDGAVLLVEWGDVAEPVLGGDHLEVRLTDRGSSERLIEVVGHGPSWEERADRLRQALSSRAAGGGR
jgi:tRNA threonylcarbamoyladenosine biosynthesis protein TsaE